MSTYQTLAEKLQRLTIIEFILLKLIYFTVGLFVVSVYANFQQVSVWWYLLFAVVASGPLYLRLFGFRGNFIQEMKQYLENNNPSNQVLTLFACFNLGIVFTFILPFLVNVYWWVYILIIILFAILPFRKVALNK